MKSKPPKSIFRLAASIVLLFCLGVWFTDRAPREVMVAKPNIQKNAVTVTPQVAVLPPWSEVQPANHGTNPIPEGFIQTEVYDDVARLAFPTPAPVAAGLRARVLLGEISGATGRHKFVRIEEVASIKENRLVERRVMPADHVVVRVPPGTDEAQLGASLAAGFEVRRKLLLPDAYLVGFNSADEGSLEAAITALQQEPAVLEVAPDGYVFSAATPNDPLFNQQWGLHNTGQLVNGGAGTVDADVDAPEAWETGTGTTAVTVAVIDSGIDLTHEDLVDNIWTNPRETGLDGSGHNKATNGIDDDGNGRIDDVNGWDFANDDNVPQDDFGHGTHVAGIIGAKGNNGVGVAGICWTVRLVALKALRSNGSGLWSDVTDALIYARINKLGIVNCSLGAYGSMPNGAYTGFHNSPDLLIFGAAGNGSIGLGGVRQGDDVDQIPFMPAGMEDGNVVSVAATDAGNVLASFSNFGAVNTDFGAPGVNILSTRRGGGYEQKSGTSMAVAYASGAAALFQSLKPRATPLEIRHALQMCVSREQRMSSFCLTEGHLNLQKLALYAGGRYPWRHLAKRTLGNTSTGGLSSHYGHILPNGQLAARFGSQGAQRPDAKSGDNFPSSDLLSLFEDSPFVLDGNLDVWFQKDSTFHFYTLPSQSLDRFTKVSGISNVVSIAGTRINQPVADSNAVAFLKADGTVWTWGRPAANTGRPTAQNGTLAQVSSLSNVIQVVSDYGGRNYYCLTKTGQVWVFGANTLGRLGLGHTTIINTPVQLSGLPAIDEIWVFENDQVLRAVDGRIFKWRAMTPTQTPAEDTFWTAGNTSVPVTSFQGTAAGVLAVRNASVLSSGTDAANWIAPPTGVTSLICDPSGKNAPLCLLRNGDVAEFGKTNRSFFQAEIPAEARLLTSSRRWQTGMVEVFAGRSLNVDGRCYVWSDVLRAMQSGQAEVTNLAAEIRALRNADSVAMAEYSLLRITGGIVDYVPTTSSLAQTVSAPVLGGNTLASLAGFPYAVDVRPAAPSDKLLGSFRGAWLFSYGPSGSTAYNLALSRQNQNTANPLPVWQPLRSGNIKVVTTDSWSAGAYALACDLSAGAARFFSVTTTATTNAGGPIMTDVSGSLPTQLTANGFADVEIAPISSSTFGLIILTSAGEIWVRTNVPSLAPGTTIAGASLSYLTTIPGVVELAWPYVRTSAGAVFALAYPAPAAPTPIATMLLPGTAAGEGITALLGSDAMPGAGGPTNGFNERYYLALRTDGRVLSWGSNTAGMQGRGSAPASGPAVLPGLGNVTQLWAGRQFACAKRTDGSVWGWGRTGVYGSTSQTSEPVNTPDYGVSPLLLNTGTEELDWYKTYFSSEEVANINISGDEADPDRDGLTNLVEYALGSDPKVPSDTQGDEPGLTASFETVSSEALNLEGDTSDAGAGQVHFVVKLQRRVKRPGIEYRVELSDDMVNWSAGADRLQKVLESPTLVAYRDIEPLSVTPRRWARLVIRKGN